MRSLTDENDRQVYFKMPDSVPFIPDKQQIIYVEQTAHHFTNSAFDAFFLRYVLSTVKEWNPNQLHCRVIWWMGNVDF